MDVGGRRKRRKTPVGSTALVLVDQKARLVRLEVLGFQMKIACRSHRGVVSLPMTDSPTLAFS